MNIELIIAQLDFENLKLVQGVTIAAIAAVPATVTAAAAWRKSASTNRKLKTSNGDTIGQITEMNYELSKSTSHRMDELSKSLEVHIHDQTKHCLECTRQHNEMSKLERTDR